MNINEKLQNELANMIAHVNDGASFLVSELPDVISQLLMWRSVKSGAVFMIGVILLALSAKSVVWVKRSVKESREAYDRGERWTRYSGCDSTTSHEYDLKAGVFVWIIPVFLLIVGACVAANNLDWLQILIAPKVYLIEYAAKLAGA